VLALEIRPLMKRRGLEAMFGGLEPGRAAQYAERVAGIAGVAHALALAHAVERALDVQPPPRAELWRVVHAELERVANHLDVAMRLAEDAALSVGTARLGILKEDIMRLRAVLTGSRFGRGAVVPGGVAGEPHEPPTAIARAVGDFDRALRKDRRLLVRTTSLTDRLIGSGALDRDTVDRLAGVGPAARAAGVSVDVRLERPYGAYRRLGFRVATADAGDAMARLQVRLGEIDQSIHLMRQAIDSLRREEGPIRTELPSAGDGAAFGWAEAPQGEVVYWAELAGGYLWRVRIWSPSMRNWPLLAAAFRGDVLTDFAFIEHSFGLTPAGADR
jgi:Ni,Fe-hydrogenase III large subunit